MKSATVLVAAMSLGLSGCLETLPRIPDSIPEAISTVSGVVTGNNALSLEIARYLAEHPEMVNYCLPLRNGFTYASGKVSIGKGSDRELEDVRRYDQLVRLGLFSRQDNRTHAIFRITAKGKENYANGPCMMADPYTVWSYKEPALVYGQLNFFKIDTVAKSYPPTTGTAFIYRQFGAMTWGADKEMRRTWGLNGIKEIEARRWRATYSMNSNGTHVGWIGE